MMVMFNSKINIVNMDAHKKQPSVKVTKRIFMWIRVTTLCLFLGIIASCCSQGIVITKDYTHKETVGIISHQGFPIWWKGTASGYAWADFRPVRFIANWLVWAIIFMLFSCAPLLVKKTVQFSD